MALINFRYLRSRQLLFFAPYLILLSVQELGIHIYLNFHPTQKTGVLYNISRPVSTTFFALFFYLVPVNRPFRKLIAWMLGVYLTLVSVTFVFLHPITEYNSYLSLASAFVISCSGILFLFNYFNLDNVDEEKKWRAVVWISTGLVIFYPVTNIVFAFHKKILAVDASILETPLHQAVPRIMSIFMYGCFTYAFYLCQKKN
jgi:hypothetical protein